MALVRLNIARGCWHAGRELRAGDVIELDASDALPLLAGGRALLADSRDAATIREAARAELDRTM